MEDLHGTYSLTLVLMSLMAAVLSCWGFLELCRRTWTLGQRARRLWKFFGSLAMGLGVWLTHLTGRLAYRTPVDIQYDAGYTLLSILLPVLGTGAALSIMNRKQAPRPTLRLLFCALLLGTGMLGMLYTGLAAMRLRADLSYAPAFVTLTAVLAYTVSYGLFRVIYSYGERGGAVRPPVTQLRQWTVSLLLGIPIAAMHYAGMSSAHFTPWPAQSAYPPGVEGFGETVLIVWIGAAALLISLVAAGSQFLERRFAQHLAEMNRQRYDSIFEHNPDMVCLFDTEGRLLRTNPAVQRITGYDAGAFPRRSFTRLVSRRDIARIRACFSRVQQGIPQTVECTIRHRDGRPVHLSTTLVPMMAGGRIVDIYTISKDITEQKKAERQLVRAKQEAERAARLKSEFLAVMSHEIRTPLNGIIGMSELLLETELSGDQQELLQVVRRSGRSLLSIINDVLDFSKMESGAMVLREEPFDLNICLDEIIQIFAGELLQKDIQVLTKVDPFLPEWLLGDEGRLRQVLINLIGNAMKFTEQGEIEIEIRQISREGERVELAFSVRDTGSGIPESFMPHLFQPFYQLESAARSQGGTGLGLAISRKLVELMGGRIWAESMEGAGSTFHFTIQTRCCEDRIAAQLQA